MKRYLTTCFLALVVLAAFLSGNAATRGQEGVPTAPPQQGMPGDSCDALDIIFLVDQSDSMVDSDPNNQREYAIEAMIDHLAFLKLNRCQEVQHRIAVISFSREAEVDLEFRNVEPDDNPELKSAIQATNSPWTNPQDAFREALRIFNDTDQLGGVRKRVIIFITDGQPCVPPCDDPCAISNHTEAVRYAQAMQLEINQDFPFDEALLDREICLEDLREDQTIEILPEEINACIANHPLQQPEDDVYQNSTYIWTLMLQPTCDYPPGLQEIYEEVSQSHAGQMVYLSQNRQEISSRLREILDQLIGVRAIRLDCGNFAVNPYLESASFDFYKFDPESQVRISYVDDGEIYEVIGAEQNPLGGFDLESYYQLEANEGYVFQSPRPGIWQLESEGCENIDIFYQPISINLDDCLSNLPDALSRYPYLPYYDEASPIRLECVMRDADNDVISQIPEFPIDVQLTATGPDGTQRVYGMTWQEDQTLFRADKPLQVSSVGTYTFEVIGMVMEHAGDPLVTSADYVHVFNSPYELFRHQTSVASIEPFIVAVLSPIPGGEVEVYRQDDQPLSIPIVVEILDHRGNPLTDVNEAFVDVDSTLWAEVSSASGRQHEEVNLAAMSTQPGFFSGEVIVTDSTETDWNLSIQIQGQIHDGYQPMNWHIQTDFRLVEITDLEQSEALWIQTFLAIWDTAGLPMMAIIAMVITGIIYYRMRHREIIGRLYFEGFLGGRLEHFPIYHQWTIIRLGRQKKFQHLDLKLVVVRGPNKRDQNIHIRYVTRRSGREGRFSLPAYEVSSNQTIGEGEAIEYSGGAVARMVYEPKAEE